MRIDLIGVLAFALISYEKIVFQIKNFFLILQYVQPFIGVIMAAIKKIEREYTMEDLDMLQLAQVFHDNFVIDETAFVAAFPMLDAPFAANFQTAIDAADDIPSGAEVDSLIAVITEGLNNQMPLARAALQKLFTYADLTWNSLAKTDSFGKNRYGKARQSQIRIKELLELAHRQAEVAANKADLIASGYTQGDIDELETIMDEIDSLNRDQEDALSNRGIQTQVRVTAMNAVWEFMRQINKTSKVVFVDSPAKLDMYLLYPTTHSGLPKVQNLEVSVSSGSPYIATITWTPAVGATEYQMYQSVVPQGDPPGDFEWYGAFAVTETNLPVIYGYRYWYKVRAINATQEGAFSDPAFGQP